MIGRIGHFGFLVLFSTAVAAAQNPKSRAAYEVGLAHQASGNHAAAVGDFTAALTAARKYPAALRARALSYAVLGQDASALADLDQALVLKKDDLGTWNARGDLHLRRGEFDAAASDFTHVLGQNSDPALRLRRGTAYRGLGRYVEARQDLDLAIAASPENPEAYYQRAQVSAAEEKWAAAEDDLNRAIEQNPDYIPAYLERGVVRHKLDANIGAMADLTRYLEHAPEHSRALGTRGAAHMTLGDKTDAESDLRRALKANPANEQAAEALAALQAAPQASNRDPAPVIATKMEKTEYTALPPLAPEPAVAVGPRPAVVSPAVVAPVTAGPVTPARPQAELHNTRGRELNSQNQFKLALTEFDQAIQLDPNFAQAFNSRGYTFIRLGRAKEAISDLNRAIDINPAYKNAHQNRGAAKRALGDIIGAEADAAKAAMLTE